jgi:hypothetical protein
MQPTAQALAEKLSIRIGVCLQAYRNSMKNGSGFSTVLDVPTVKGIFRSLASRGYSGPRASPNVAKD